MTDDTTRTVDPSEYKFPSSFWTANVTELFERAAYYAIAAFVVTYLGQLGMGKYWPSTLNGLLWTLIYFLPILSGTVADQVGFKRSLLVAFVLLAVGYFLMGYPVWFGGHVLTEEIAKEMTATTGVFLPVLMAILLIGLGGSVIKPCISGTVQKTAGSRATLAFAIFYMVINIGSLLGRVVCYITRKPYGLSSIFLIGAVFSVIAFFTVLFFYKDPEAVVGQAEEKKPGRSVWRILADMVLVLRNLRFSLFLLVLSGFWFLYVQVYNVIPLYLKKVVDLDPAIDIITIANPLTIVCFQLLITRLFGKWRPVNSIIVGALVIGLAWLVNLVPIFTSGGLRQLTLWDWVPLASVFAALTVSLIAFGELFTAARAYEYIGALAPRGKEGLFLGYANLPVALGSLAGGPVGAVIFYDIMCRNSTSLENKLLELDPTWNMVGWFVLCGIGFASAFGMWLFNLWLKRQTA